MPRDKNSSSCAIVFRRIRWRQQRKCSPVSGQSMRRCGMTLLKSCSARQLAGAQASKPLGRPGTLSCCNQRARCPLAPQPRHGESVRWRTRWPCYKLFESENDTISLAAR